MSKRGKIVPVCHTKEPCSILSLLPSSHSFGFWRVVKRKGIPAILEAEAGDDEFKTSLVDAARLRPDDVVVEHLPNFWEALG